MRLAESERCLWRSTQYVESIANKIEQKVCCGWSVPLFQRRRTQQFWFSNVSIFIPKFFQLRFIAPPVIPRRNVTSNSSNWFHTGVACKPFAGVLAVAKSACGCARRFLCSLCRFCRGPQTLHIYWLPPEDHPHFWRWLFCAQREHSQERCTQSFSLADTKNEGSRRNWSLQDIPTILAAGSNSAASLTFSNQTSNKSWPVVNRVFIILWRLDG